MTATFFSSELDFRAWLDKNHLLEKELIVGYFKVGSGKPSMTWSQSVDQALCFGWIDGVRRSIDKDSYCIRFTPRRPNSIWSDINIKKVAELSKLGLMKTEGLAAFQLRKEDKSGIYSHETAPSEFDTSTEKHFKSNKLAWDFFVQQAPSYQKVMKHWIMSAKQEKTKLSRLNKLIESSERQLKLT
jgi:uncharacterized protein YdeI (YjbR/CyaY-like superfamily)